MEVDQRAKASAAKSAVVSAGSAQSPTAASASNDAMDLSQSIADVASAANGSQTDGDNGSASTVSQQPVQRNALDYVEEIASVLKTAFPLLALSVELVCDQISARFKAVPDEDIFRLVTALLQDGLQVRKSPKDYDFRVQALTPFVSNTSIVRQTLTIMDCWLDRRPTTSLASLSTCRHISEMPSIGTLLRLNQT